MTDATWFRLLLRAVGVLLLGLSLPTLIDRMASLAGALMAPAYSGRDFSWTWILWLAGPLLQFGLAGYLIIGPSRLERMCMWGLDVGPQRTESGAVAEDGSVPPAAAP
jgi:hypothetical protein